MSKRQKVSQEAITDAMKSLLQNQNFLVFIDVVREQKEAAVAYACEHTAVKDQRECLAALGEIRAYAVITNYVDGYYERIIAEQDNPGPASLA